MSSQTFNQSEKEIETLLYENIKHVYDADKEALLSSFADDVTIFDLEKPLEFRGKETLDMRLTKWFASYEGHITQEIESLNITAGEDVGVSHCLMRTFGTGVDGEERNMWYRVTCGFKKQKGQWKIMHEHVSEPIDLNSGKALFDLEP